MKFNSELRLSGRPYRTVQHQTLKRETLSAHVTTSWWKAPRKLPRRPFKNLRGEVSCLGGCSEGRTPVIWVLCRIPVTSPYPALWLQTLPCSHAAPAALSFWESSSHGPTELLLGHLDARSFIGNSETFTPLPEWPCGTGGKRTGTAQMQGPTQNGLPGKQDIQRELQG